MSSVTPGGMDGAMTEGLIGQRPLRTGRDYRLAKSGRNGQFTELTVYDPKNRGSEYIERLLDGHDLHADIEDEGPEIPPRTARPSS